MHPQPKRVYIESCFVCVCVAAALWVGTDNTSRCKSLLSNPLPAKSSPVIPAGGSPLQGNTAGEAGGSPWFVSVILMITLLSDDHRRRLGFYTLKIWRSVYIISRTENVWNYFLRASSFHILGHVPPVPTGLAAWWFQDFSGHRAVWSL